MTQEHNDKIAELVQRVGILEGELKLLGAKSDGTQEAAEAMCGILDRLIKKLSDMTGPEGELGKQICEHMHKDMDEQYRKRFESLFDMVVELDVGDSVICDLCGKDWTGVETSGGFMFGAKAICPDCAPKIEASAVECGEGHLIDSRCPPNMNHDDWIRDMIRPALEKGIDLRTINDWKEERGEKDG